MLSAIESAATAPSGVVFSSFVVMAVIPRRHPVFGEWQPASLNVLIGTSDSSLVFPEPLLFSRDHLHPVLRGLIAPGGIRCFLIVALVTHAIIIPILLPAKSEGLGDHLALLPGSRFHVALLAFVQRR